MRINAETRLGAEKTYSITDPSSSTGLLGDELRTNHLACIFLGLLGAALDCG